MHSCLLLCLSRVIGPFNRHMNEDVLDVEDVLFLLQERIYETINCNLQMKIYSTKVALIGLEEATITCKSAAAQ